MKKLLLVEDEAEHINRFLEFFKDRYIIDTKRSVNSAIKLVNERANDYDLFILDANLPEEDVDVWEGTNPEAWIRIRYAIEEKLGEDSSKKIIIRTAHQKEPGAVGTSILAIDKGLGLEIFEVFMENVWEPFACKPSILMVTRASSDAKDIEETFKTLGADVKRIEAASSAIKLVKDGKRLFQLLFIQLNLPPEDLSDSLGTTFISSQSTLQIGFKVIDEVRQHSPLTMIAAIYPKSGLESGISHTFAHFGIGLVSIIENNNLRGFIAKCFGELKKQINSFAQIGEALNSYLLPTFSSINELTNLVAGNENSPIFQNLRTWLSNTNKAKWLLVTANNIETSETFISALDGVFEVKGWACEMLDCRDACLDDKHEELSGLARNITEKNRPLVLVFRNISPVALNLLFTTEIVTSLLSRTADIRFVASIEINQILVIRDQIRRQLNNQCQVVTVPDLKNITPINLSSLIRSHFLVLGTYHGILNISFDQNISDYLIDKKGEYSAFNLWPILTSTFHKVAQVNNSVVIEMNTFVEALESYIETKSQLPEFTEGGKIQIANEEHRLAIQRLFNGYKFIDEAYSLGATGLSGARLYVVRAEYQPIAAPKAYRCPRRVVKVNLRRKIRYEYENYTNWVKPFQDRNVARIESCDYESSWGAIAYWLVSKSGESGKLLDFDEYFRLSEVTPDAIVNVIKFVFRGLLYENWYSESKDDSDEAGFNWFYGRHLPPLLEVKINEEEGIYKGEELGKFSGDARHEVWDIVDKLSSSEDEIEGNLLHLGSLVVPYVEERDQKQTIIATHKCGAEIEIRADPENWERIERFGKRLGRDIFRIGVCGTFRSRQLALLTELAASGFADIGLSPNFQLKMVNLGPITVLNPLSIYQKYLRGFWRSRQSKGIIHGDLHWRNILVDRKQPESPAWLIDFGRTGLGPIIFDAIELETDLLLSVITKMSLANGNIPDFLEVAQILENIKQQKLDSHYTDPTFNKVFLTIQQIRESIRDYLPGGVDTKDWGAYYVGLSLLSLGLLRHFRREDGNEDNRRLINIRRRICFIIAAKAAEFAQLEDRSHDRELFT